MLALVANWNIPEAPFMAAAHDLTPETDPCRATPAEPPVARVTHTDRAVLIPQPWDTEADWEEPRRGPDRFLMILLRALSAWNT
jgi:hypothetical protein